MQLADSLPIPAAWIGIIVLGTILMFVLLIAYMVHVVTKRARPEDLPTLLHAFAAVITSLGNLVPTGRRVPPPSDGMSTMQRTRPTLDGQVVARATQLAAATHGEEEAR